MKQRSRISQVIACVAVSVGLIALSTAEAAQPGKAVVRRIVGSAEYSEGGVWMPLKANMQLGEGAVVRTANDSEVLLFLDKNGPLVKLSENTTLGLDKMQFEVTGVDTVVETQLDVKSGRIVGITRKLSATSKYEVKTPNGVAGIRGTEYAITAAGEVYVVEGSVVVVSVQPDGTVVTHVVNAGEWFNPATGAVETIPADVLNQIINELTWIKGGPGVVVVTPIIEFTSPTVGDTSSSNDE